jgi:putative phage-type endonuclease
MIDTRQLEQGSPEWKLARLGHVSASGISDVMSKIKTGESATRRKYKIKLVAERLTNKPQESFTNAAMEWGVETEPQARMAYEVSRGTFVEKTGFWIHPRIPFVGASPDGLVGDEGLIEIKCPNTTTHLEYIWNNEVPSEYMKQMQMQMWITGRQWCDFVSFDPRLPEKNQLFVIRCDRDDPLISQIENEVLGFLKEIELIMEKLGAQQ